MMEAAPTTRAPAAVSASIVSRVEPPVVTTSSTTRTLSPGRTVKPRRKRHPPGLALGPDEARAEGARHLVADDEAADGGRGHGLDSLARKSLGERLAEARGLGRVLQEQRTLQVVRAVQPARQNEVAFQQRARPPESFDDFFRLQTSHLIIHKGMPRALQCRRDAAYGAISFPTPRSSRRLSRCCACAAGARRPPTSPTSSSSSRTWKRASRPCSSPT